MTLNKKQLTLVAAASMLSAGSASAIVVTPTMDATILANALLGGGGAGIDLSTLTISVNGQTSGGALSAGTYTNASNTYGIGDGILISSGDAADYGDGPNTSSGNTTGYGVSATVAQEALLDPITGGALNHNDVTQIDIGFDMLPTFDTVFFNVTFGSDEYPEFIGSSFIDAFGLYVNGTNIASVNGAPINIDHTDMAAVAGTELDGILGGATGAFGPYVHTFSTGVNATGNNLTFIIADSGDTSLDSTAYISQLGGTPPEQQIPEPATVALFGFGLAALGVRRRKKQA